MSDRLTWLKERKPSSGGSDITRILGVARFGGPWDVWSDKTAPDEAELRPMTEAQMHGHLLESAILEWFMHAQWHKPGVLVRDPYLILRHTAHRRAHVTPDGLVRDPDNWRVLAYLEAKVVGPRHRQAYLQSGLTAETGKCMPVPIDNFIQCQWGLSILRSIGETVEGAYLIAMLGVHDFRWYWIKSDELVQERLHQRNDEFWRLYIEPQVPPPPDGSDAATEWLDDKAEARLAEKREAFLNCDQISESLTRRWHDAHEREITASQELQLIEQQMQEHLQNHDATAAVGEWYAWRYQQRKGYERVDYKRAFDRLADHWGLDKGVRDAYISAARVPVAGSTTFRVEVDAAEDAAA